MHCQPDIQHSQKFSHQSLRVPVQPGTLWKIFKVSESSSAIALGAMRPSLLSWEYSHPVLPLRLS